MSTDSYDDILMRAKKQLSVDEQRQLAEALSQHVAQKNGPQTGVVDAREQRKGPATTEYGRKLRELRKQHLAEGGRLLTMDEIDELVAECQGSLHEKE